MASAVADEIENFARTHSLTSAIGNMPLFKLRNVARDLPPGVEVYAKGEHLNPGGSVKDRPALNMILEGERSGQLKPGMTILDATSGNTGIAYGMIGAARGYRVVICLPANASEHRKLLLKKLNVELVETDPLEATDGAQLVARKMFAEAPDKYFYPDQYNNPANWRAHYESTALEIWQQTGGRVTHFVAGLGTSGTFVGTTRRLKELSPALHAVAVQPDSPFHGLEGLKHMDTAIVPGIYDPHLADQNLAIKTEDGLNMAQRLAREEGLLVGNSSGANVFAALQVAQSLNREAVVVTILCDGGD